MAMIDIGLGEFISGLIDEKSAGGNWSEAERLRSSHQLLAVADRAVDVAIMNAVMRMAMDGEVNKRVMEKLHGLMTAGAKDRTDSYVRKILPDVDEVVAAELLKLKGMYLRGKTRS